MASLLDKVTDQEQTTEKEKKVAEPKKKAVNQISGNDGEKDKQISAKVNTATWATFTEINKAQGLSNNSALNMIINKYVRDNKGILEE